ncbi:hypothetical protein D3C80_1798910 [compost metagenome]
MPLNGEYSILSGNIVAIRKLHAVTQYECIGQAIFTNVMGLGKPVHNFTLAVKRY